MWLASIVEQHGILAVPTGTISHTLFDAKTGRWRNIVSAKHCAVAAGLGRIGKNTLVVTPEYGNMVWLNAVLTDVRSVGVKGDHRTYDPVVAVRAVDTTDFMTCEYTPLPHKTLHRIASRITGEIRAVSRVVYDITGKPPATVEWE